MTDALLLWLQSWYLTQCDDEWEHAHGVTIETLDNPGWSLKVTIQGTPLEHRAFDSITIERSEDDWLRCWLSKDRIGQKALEAACGPNNLTEVLECFRSWASKAS